MQQSATPAETAEAAAAEAPAEAAPTAEAITAAEAASAEAAGEAAATKAAAAESTEAARVTGEIAEVVLAGAARLRFAVGHEEASDAPDQPPAPDFSQLLPVLR